MRQISREIRRTTRNLFLQGLSLRAIARQVEISSETVRRVTHGLLRRTDAAHTGRPSIVTRRISSMIARLANQERAVSAREIRDEVHSSAGAYLSLQTIRNVLKEKGFVSSSRPR
ncbi:hypothetical protein ENBRE01_3377, partial [Enteropsectra breve]